MPSLLSLICPLFYSLGFKKIIFGPIAARLTVSLCGEINRLALACLLDALRYSADLAIQDLTMQDFNFIEINLTIDFNFLQV